MEKKILIVYINVATRRSLTYLASEYELEIALIDLENFRSEGIIAMQ